MNLRKIYRSRLWLVVLIGLAAGLSAQAQNTTFNPVTGNWEFNPWSTQNVMQRQMERSSQIFGTGGAGMSGGATVLPRDLAASWTNTFNKIMQNGAANRASRGRQIIKSGRATTSFNTASTPVLVKYFTGNYTQSSVASNYLPRSMTVHRKFLQGETYSPNDVVDNFLLGVEVYYLIYKGDWNSRMIDKIPSPYELDRPKRAAVRRQISDALLNSEDFQGLSDEQKQAVHEMFSIALINAMVDTQDAEGNPTKMRGLQAAAGYALQQITGIPPQKIVITNEGISSK